MPSETHEGKRQGESLPLYMSTRESLSSLLWVCARPRSSSSLSEKLSLGRNKKVCYTRMSPASWSHKPKACLHACLPPPSSWKVGLNCKPVPPFSGMKNPEGECDTNPGSGLKTWPSLWFLRGKASLSYELPPRFTARVQIISLNAYTGGGYVLAQGLCRHWK